MQCDSQEESSRLDLVGSTLTIVLEEMQLCFDEKSLSRVKIQDNDRGLKENSRVEQIEFFDRFRNPL